MVSGSTLLSALITLVVVGLICWLVWWFISYIGLPEPFNKVARVLVALVALVFLINFLLGFTGHPLIKW
jgi:hypothetical protein